MRLWVKGKVLPGIWPTHNSESTRLPGITNVHMSVHYTRALCFAEATTLNCTKDVCLQHYTDLHLTEE